MEPSLLAALIADPSDDWPRLVAADWLEENGQADRAEFIRVQVALEPLRGHGHGAGNPHGGDCAFCYIVAREERREQVLRGLHGDTWALPLALAAGFPDTPMYGATSGKDTFGNPRYHNICSGYASDVGRRLAWTFRRGFVASIETDTKTFLAHGPALVACQPLERVTLSDLTLYGPLEHGPNRGGWFWLLRDMPKELRPYMGFADRMGGAVADRYATKEEAESALSLAALMWARQACVRCIGTGRITLVDIYPRTGVDSRHCPDCTGTGKRWSRTADMPRPEQSAVRAPI